MIAQGNALGRVQEQPQALNGRDTYCALAGLGFIPVPSPKFYSGLFSYHLFGVRFGKSSS